MDEGHARQRSDKVVGIRVRGQDRAWPEGVCVLWVRYGVGAGGEDDEYNKGISRSLCLQGQAKGFPLFDPM